MTKEGLLDLGRIPRPALPPSRPGGTKKRAVAAPSDDHPIRRKSSGQPGNSSLATASASTAKGTPAPASSRP